MGASILIILGVLSCCAAFAAVGATIGSRIEAKNMGAGTVEENMRSGLTASIVGGLMGMIPFLAFVIVLAITVVVNPAHPEDHAAAGAPAAH